MKKNLLLISICALFLFAGCNSKTNSINEGNKSSKINTKINQKDGLSAESFLNENNEVIVTVKNEGEELVDHIGIDVAVYDKKGVLIKVDKQYLRNIEKGKTGIVKLSLVDFSEEEKEVTPAKIEIALNKTIYTIKSETIYSDKVSGTLEKVEDGKLKLNVNNTSGAVIDSLEGAVVFYKDSKPIDVFQVTAQDVGENHTEEIFVPMVSKNSQNEYINYDNVEFVVNNASKFNNM